MRQLSEDLKSHISGDVTTLCNAWRVTRKDGQIFGFTDHDQNLEFDGTIFHANSGFVQSEVQSELGLNIDESDVTGAFSNVMITKKDLQSGRYDEAKVEVFMLNWQTPNDFIKLRTQEIGQVSFSENMFRAQLRSIAHKLDQQQGRRYGRSCDADLGDARCKVDLQNPIFQGVGTVGQVLNDSDILASGLSAFESGWFRFGLITWQTGENAGLSVEINNHEINQGLIKLTFWTPPAHSPKIGDQFSIVAGCGKTFQICREKFNNGLNFRGFPHLPGSDFAYGYVDEDTIHDGRPLVT